MDVEAQHLIAAYQEELTEAHRNRVLLLAALRQSSATLQAMADRLAEAQAGEPASEVEGQA